MKKIFWVTVATGISCATISLISVIGITIAWFSIPNAIADKEQYLDGDIGLRNYFYAGDGLTPETAYEIVSPIHFYNLTRLQNLGIFTEKKYFQIGHYFDIDDDPNTPDVLRCINGYNLDGTPIYNDYLEMGSDSPLYISSTMLPIGSEGKPFYGTFDGKGVPVKNLTVTGYPEDIGVFGYVAHEGEVKGLVCENLTIESLGYNSVVGDKDNLLFSENIDDIFANASYLDTADLSFYYFKDNEDEYINISGDGNSLKSYNGTGGTALIGPAGTGINNSDNLIADTYFFNGYFEYKEPTYNRTGKDPFTYSWKSSSPIIKMSDVNINGKKQIAIDLNPLHESSSFNSGDDMQVDAKLSLIASVEVDGFVFSRVIQSYTVEFYSHGHTWVDSEDTENPTYYTANIFCDYVEAYKDPENENDHYTNYHHGNNIGFLAGHVDGSMKNCYVYNPSTAKGGFVFNSGDGYTNIATETDSGLIGEIGTNVQNNIDADIGLVINGDTGIMNFSKIYSNIRSDAYFETSSYTYKSTYSTTQELPIIDGDYCLAQYPSQRIYLKWINGNWIFTFSNKVSPYRDHASIPQVEDDQYYKNQYPRFQSITDLPGPTVLANGDQWRLKECPPLYLVYNKSASKWEPYFTMTWNEETEKWVFDSSKPTTDAFHEKETIETSRSDSKTNFSTRSAIALTTNWYYRITNPDPDEYYIYNGTDWDMTTSDPSAVDNTYYGGHERTNGKSYYSYNKFINEEKIDLFSDYLRYYTITDGQKQFIAQTTEKNLNDASESRQWMTHTMDNPPKSDYNRVDFLWNRVIQDEKGKDRGLGVFKVVSSYNEDALTGSFSNYRLSNLSECTIENKAGNPKTKVYFSTAEFDHQAAGGSGTGWGSGGIEYPLRATSTPSYSDLNSFKWPFSRDYNYVFELDLSEMESTGGNDYMWNTKSEFLQNYLGSKLINKKGEPITAASNSPRFGFMFRSDENELLNSLTSYMPVGVPGSKGKSKYTTYYQWDGDAQKWVSTEFEPTEYTDCNTVASYENLPLEPTAGDYYQTIDDGLYYVWNANVWNKRETKPCVGVRKGLLSDVKDLPNNPDSNDYYEVSAYYPSNSIVFRVANSHGANVSVVGRNDDITIYSYDPTNPDNDVEALYTMRSGSQTSTDDHKYFKYNVTAKNGNPAGYTTNVTEKYSGMGDGGCLYGHIFKLEQGTYVIGAKSGTAHIYFLAVQGQTDASIGATDVATIGNGIENVEFLLKEPHLSDYDDEDGISDTSMLAYSSFKALFNISSGTFKVSVVNVSDEKYLKLTYNSPTETATYLLTYISEDGIDDGRRIYLNELETPVVDKSKVVLPEE